MLQKLQENESRATKFRMLGHKGMENEPSTSLKENSENSTRYEFRLSSDLAGSYAGTQVCTMQDT